MQNWNIEQILTVMVGITGFAVLLQAGVLLAMFLTMRKAMKLATDAGNLAKTHVEEIRAAVIPVLDQSKELIHTTRDVIARLEPKLESAANDLAEIARAAREQAEKIEASADEIRERVRQQAERVDGMTTSALDGVNRVGHFINSAVSMPVRQVSGVVAAAKAIVEALRAPAPHRAPHAHSNATDEKDLFV